MPFTYLELKLVECLSIILSFFQLCLLICHCGPFMEDVRFSYQGQGCIYWFVLSGIFFWFKCSLKVGKEKKNVDQPSVD